MTKENEPEVGLGDIRKNIDAIDLKIHALLNDRAEAALKVADIKLREASGAPVDFYRPEREAQILNEVASRNQGPMSDRAVQRIFREIISASLALEEPMRVAYLGPEGTYSQTAAERHFGHAVITQPESGISEIFSAVENERARFGVVPVENSTEGAINQTLDLLTTTSLRICGELSLRIQHQLLSRQGNLTDVKAVHAHPQSLAQCRHWLDANLPGIPRISESSNAAAAHLAVDDNRIAAIAGDAAASHYELTTLAAGIEDVKNNTTRFYVIGNQRIPPSGKDSTSLLVSAPHRPGGLLTLLEPLERAGISMTRIESRPDKSAMWEYVFFIDVDGHEDDGSLKTVLQELREIAPMLRVLGSYPRAL